jgi:hypothetical protein
MADTLIREAIAYGSQPLSPTPQYWDGSTSYEKAQGINGAIRVINYNTAGETLTNTLPGTIQVVTSAGATNSFSSSNPGSVQLTATSTVSISGTSSVSFSGTNTVEVVTSAGATALFSSTNPGSVQLTATSTVNFSGSGTVVVSGTATVNFSGSGTVVVSGTSTVTFSGSETVNISGNVTALNQVVGTQANAWSASATVTSGATSNSIDLQYNYRISYFGSVTNTASLTLALEVSQNNTNFYQAATNTITAGTTSPFHYSTETAARYARLTVSGVSATITATIAGK